MKIIQIVFAIATLVLTFLAAIKVFETEKFTALEYFILSNTAMLITVVVAGFVQKQNEQNNQTQPGLSE